MPAARESGSRKPYVSAEVQPTCMRTAPLALDSDLCLALACLLSCLTVLHSGFLLAGESHLLGVW